jgi:hypothetical protein
MHPTVLVVSFNTALDPVRATDVNNYSLVGPSRRRIPFASATYDASAFNVTLRPRERVNLHRDYQLTIRGAGANAVTSASHISLAGADQVGTDYLTTLTWEDAVLPAPQARQLQGQLARGAHRSR